MALPLQFAPIDVASHFDVCERFLCDAFLCSYGHIEHYDQIGGAAGYRRMLCDSLAAFPEGVVHVWRDGLIVGQVELRLHAEPRLGVVNLFYLVPEGRGIGLGGELQRYAVDVFRARGARKARLSVAPANARAVRFYLKHGWRDCGPRPDRQYVHAMEFDLPTQSL